MITIDGLVMCCVYTFMQMCCRAAASYWDGLHDLNVTQYTHMHAYVNAETHVRNLARPHAHTHKHLLNN